jgi:hypothetical protein
MDRLNKAQMEFMNGYVPANIHDIYDYKEGGGIHIKDSKKGTFTAAATKHGKSVQAFASQVLANKDNYSSAMVKKANFAKNASKWKHQEGGVAQGDQGNDQMMQMIQSYAQMLAQESGEDPNKVYQEVMGQLQQMKPEQQQQAIQEIVKQVQGVSQQPAMQMGGDPSQMQQAPQEQQGGDEQQLMQQIQQMLEQGAEPQEVIAQLLQAQVDPQMVVQIFVQLGMPQEQVVQAVEAVMQQMGAGQEQENPQEQMQEQGMEEPMQQGMKYGGIAKYPYGGIYADKKYYGDFLPQDAFNNAMTDINMLAQPAAALSASGSRLARIAAGVPAALSAGAASIQGYRSLFNKNTPNTKTTPYNATSKITPYDNPMQSNPVTGPQRFEDLPEAEQKWKGFPYMQKYGGLAKAQLGIPGDFDFSDPYGLQKNRFGDTANYADAQQYGANFNARPLVQPLQPMSKPAVGVGIKTNLNMPSYQSKLNPNSVNVNKKTINVPGRQVAAQALTSLGVLNDAAAALTEKSQKDLMDEAEKKSNQNVEFASLYNPTNSYGERTLNTGILKPNMYISPQDIGTSQFGRYGGATKYQNGGTAQYQQGGEYHVTHDELLKLMRNGAEVEFL